MERNNKLGQSIDFEQSFAYGRKALQYMLDKRSAATPKNYDLWYTYASGNNRTLIKEVNEIIAVKGKIDQPDLDRIHEEYLCPCKGSAAVGKIGVQIGGEIDQIMAMLEAATGKTTEYGESLGTVSEQLDSSNDETSLATIVESLMSTTHEMQENNRQLEHRLKESKEQISDLNDNLEAVRTESRTDQLTGIANRKYFDEELSSKIEEAESSGEELCLLIGDIDFFKKFNDTFGHQTGDQVLKLVAQALDASVKGRDLAARYGGEEFAVVLPNTSLQSAVSVGDHIRKVVMAKELIKKSTGENLGTITMSFGAARFHRGDTPDEIINRADACLYAAKRGGRNCVKCETDPGIDFEMKVA